MRTRARRPRGAPALRLPGCPGVEPGAPIEVSDDSGAEDRAPAAAPADRFQHSQLRASDLACLGGRRCLNDAVVNAYLALLAERSLFAGEIGFTDTFFMSKLRRDGCGAASVWAGIGGARLDAFAKFLVPVQAGSHWILLEVDFARALVNVLDSLGRRGRAFAEALIKFLKFQGIVAKFSVRFPPVPQQANTHDCGVFLLMFAKCAFEKLPLDHGSFGQRDAAAFRQTIYDDLAARLAGAR
jgi:Ulp1 family protease